MDPSDRLEYLVNTFVLQCSTPEKMGEKKTWPVLQHLKEIAELCGKGYVRDLEFGETLVLACVNILSYGLRLEFSEGLDSALASSVPDNGSAIDAKRKLAPTMMLTPQPPAGIAGVPPWAANPTPVRKPTSSVQVGKSGGWTAQPGGKPMTVAPWLSAPGSSIGAVLAKKDRTTLHGGAPGQNEAQLQHIMDACGFAAAVFGAEECSAIVSSFDLERLGKVAETAQLLCESLCSIGSAQASPTAKTYFRAGEVDTATPLGARVPQDSEAVAARAVKAALAKIYLGFETLRAFIRRALSAALLSTLRAAGPGLPAGAAGARLHSLDGGPRAASVTLAGAAAALELLAGIARGLRRPLGPRHVRELLTELLLPLHGAGGMADDVTPVLGLVHRPLVTALARDAWRLRPTLVRSRKS